MKAKKPLRKLTVASCFLPQKEMEEAILSDNPASKIIGVMTNLKAGTLVVITATCARFQWSLELFNDKGARDGKPNPLDPRVVHAGEAVALGPNFIICADILLCADCNRGGATHPHDSTRWSGA